VSPFELIEPRSLREAFAALEAPDARPMSGGTAVMLMMKAGVLKPSRLVSLRKLGLDRIEASGGALRVGAMVSLRNLEKSEAVKRGWPVITRTLRTLSNVRVRNVATLGGHLAHGDPHTDLPPLLSALGVAVLLDGEKQTIFVSAATDKPTRLSSPDEISSLKIEGDLHGSAAYKTQLLRVYLKRAIDEARNAGH